MKAIKNPLLSLAGLFALGIILNFTLNAYIHLMIMYVMVNMILAMSLNLVNGYTGQFSLGHAGFMAVGAYFTAYASDHWVIFPESLSYLNFFWYAMGAGSMAAFAGYLVGLPSLRLRGDYLAIVTLGFGEIIRVALLNMDSLGGARGYANIPGMPTIDLNFLGIPSSSAFVVGYIFCAFWILICFFTIWRLMRSSHGRGFLSVREDEVAAQAMGINTTQMKVRAFVISSFFAGVAGALYAHITSYISPSTFTFLKSVDAVIMVVLGGMGSMTGSLVAAVLVTALPEVLRPLQELTGVDLRMVIYSLMLILVMILRPKEIGRAHV